MSITYASQVVAVDLAAVAVLAVIKLPLVDLHYR
jgi:hypothetical protein